MISRRILFGLACLALAPIAVSSADAPMPKQVRFAGIHPIPKGAGGGICYIEGPHVHIYPANKLEYRDHGRDHVFVGDPVAYGYDGPRVAYKGPHPIHVDVVAGGDPDVAYCYIDGPHFHSFAPPADPDFRLEGDAYFYVGAPPKVFVDARPAYVGVNEIYRPMEYTRPVVTVEAPVGWIGARAEFVAPAVGVVVEGPRVVAPAVGVGVGVGIGADVHVALPSVHVGVNVGGPAVIVHDRPVIIEERGEREHGHHDNGRHGGHKGR